jgi:hypothetical protein
MQIEGLINKETEKAFLLQIDKDRNEWFPKSQMANIRTGRCDQEIVFDIPDWLAGKKFDDFTDYEENDAYEMEYIIGTYFDQC